MAWRRKDGKPLFELIIAMFIDVNMRHSPAISLLNICAKQINKYPIYP